MSMTASPVNFLFLLLLVCIAGWVISMFAASLLAWALSRIMGATIGFRVAGCNCVRDATIKFKKGAIESVSVGEFKLSLRKSLVKVGFGFMSRDPKLHLLISDLEVILRQSQEKDTMNRIQKSNSYSRGMWMIFANVAHFLSLSITDLVVKLPKATTEVKDLSLELFKTGCSNPVLNVKLHLSPLFVRMGESWAGVDHSGSTDAEREYAPFLCEELSVMCEFDHAREMGIGIKHVDVATVEVIENFNENLFSKTMPESSNSEMGRHLPSVNSSQRSVRNKKSILSPKEKELYLFPKKNSPFNIMNLGPRWKGHLFADIAKAHPISSIIKQLQASLLECTSATLNGCNTLLEVGPMVADLLNRTCFGQPISTSGKDNQWFQLSPEESFYLAHALKCLVIIGPDEKSKTNEELWDHMRYNKDKFPYLYKAYFHLRSKNWIVRPGLQYGVDFVAYMHHPALVHSEYAVLVMVGGDSSVNKRLQTWSDWNCALRVSGGVAKTLLVLNIHGDMDCTSMSCLEQLSVEERMIKRWLPECSREFDHRDCES